MGWVESQEGLKQLTPELARKRALYMIAVESQEGLKLCARSSVLAMCAEGLVESQEGLKRYVEASVRHIGGALLNLKKG